jgi:hypothetical protein
MMIQRIRVRLMFAWRRLCYKLYQRAFEYYILTTILIPHDQMVKLIYHIGIVEKVVTDLLNTNQTFLNLSLAS